MLTMYTVNDLPDWRLEDVTLYDNDKGEVIKHKCTNKAVWEYKDNIRVRPISNLNQMPSKFYYNVSPRDWLTEIMTTARRSVQGDISITGIQVQKSTSKILVTMKLPISFSVDSTDNYGLTMVAMNSYKQNSSQTLGAGAIRMACLNGCIFGDHTIEKWKHKSATCVDNKVSSIIEKATPIAKKYIESMKDKLISNVNKDLSSELDLHRHMLEMPDTATKVVMFVPEHSISWKYKELICQQLTTYHSTTITKYDLWNAFTYVATHKISKLVKYPQLLQDQMLRNINNMFD